MRIVSRIVEKRPVRKLNWVEKIAWLILYKKLPNVFYYTIEIDTRGDSLIVGSLISDSQANVYMVISVSGDIARIANSIPVSKPGWFDDRFILKTARLKNA